MIKFRVCGPQKGGGRNHRLHLASAMEVVLPVVALPPQTVGSAATAAPSMGLVVAAMAAAKPPKKTFDIYIYKTNTQKI